MRADIRLEGPHRDRIREALITGDFFVTPPRVVFDLEAALRGLDVGDAGRAIEDFFARTAADFLSLPSQTKRSSRSLAFSWCLWIGQSWRITGARSGSHRRSGPSTRPTPSWIGDALSSAMLMGRRSLTSISRGS